MTPLRNRPSYHLFRHFYGSLFDLGFLSEAGVASFTRLIIGVCAAFLSFGLLLTRVYAIKYVNLAAQRTAEPYQQALLADHALLIAIPMWIVAFVTILVGHALFPDELDFRVLIPLPITRRLVFAAKVGALTLFTGLFIVSAHVALAPLFLLTALSHWANVALVPHAGAFGLASLLASGFTVLAIMAIHGLLVFWAPGGRVLTASAILRSVMLCGLMLSLPFVGRLPAQASAFAAGSPWVYWAPPAWFVGLERWLLGDTHVHLARLMQIAIVALTIVSAATISAYAALYRRFDRLIGRPGAKPRMGTRGLTWNPLHSGEVPDPVFAATRAFTFLTLRRSVLHQGIVVTLSAVGLGLVANSFIGAALGDWMSRGGPPSRQLIESIVWAPFALTYVASRAVRTALLVPMEQRANWVFRMTQRDATRVNELSAAPYTLWRLGMVAPLLLLLPLQWIALGTASVVVTMVSFVCGGVLLELLMTDWSRIPFTCSYIPGKTFVPQAILTGVVSFVSFTTAGAFLARMSVAGRTWAWLVNATLLAAVLALRQRRRKMWRDTPLQFEDALPTEVNPLRLTAD